MPSKQKNLTENEIELFERMSEYLTIEQSAHVLGYAISHFYITKRRTEKMQAAYQRGHAKGIARVAKGLMQFINEGLAEDADYRAKDRAVKCMIFFLKTRARWKEASPLDEFIPEEKETEEERLERLKLAKEFLAFKRERNKTV